MKTIIKDVYRNGVEKLHDRIKDPFTRRAAKNRCRRCKKYEFNRMYWSCLECEFCCHLINFYLHERDGAGVKVGPIDREVSNLFVKHFKDQIKEAKKDTRIPSTPLKIRKYSGVECVELKDLNEY